MKKALSMLLAIVMVLSMLTMSVFAASNPTISLTTNFTTELEVGNTFTVTANLAGNTRFDGLTLSLKWNENAVRFTGFKKNGRVVASEVCDASQGYNAATVNDANGMFAALDTSGLGYDTNGMLFVANFEIVGDGALDIGFKTDSVEEFMMVANQNGQQIRLEPTLDLSAVQGLTVGGKPVGAEIPEELVELGVSAMTTDNGAVLDYELVSESLSVSGGYEYKDAPYYLVTIPQDAENVYVTFNTPLMCNQVGAEMWPSNIYGQVEELLPYEDEPADVSYADNGNMSCLPYYDKESNIVEIPVIMDVLDWNGNPTDEQFSVLRTDDEAYGDYGCSFDEEYGVYSYYVVGFQADTTGAPVIAFFAFTYAEESGEEEDIYSITIDENIVGGTVWAENTAGKKITQAKPDDVVVLNYEAEEGYEIAGFFFVNDDTNQETECANGTFNMPWSNVTIKAVFRSTHTCSYTENIVHEDYLKSEATCQSGAVYYKSCECGEFVTTADTFVSGESVTHHYVDSKCEWCGAGEPAAPNLITEIEVFHPNIDVDETTGTMSMDMVTGVSEQIDMRFAVADEELAATQVVAWFSSNETVATVVNGKVTALKAGSTVITAKAVEASGIALLADGEDVLAQFTLTVADPAAGYTVNMGADKTVVADETIQIPVVVTHTDDTVESYKSFELVFQYDPTVLTLVTGSSDTEGKDITVIDNNGTVTVRRYGGALSVGTAAITLEFTANKTGKANVKLTSAKVGTTADAQGENIPTAQVVDDITLITVTGYTVSLPQQDFAGETVVAPGESYTFEAKDKNYTYEVTATVNGEAITVNPNEDGTSFTIPEGEIDGNVVIEIANKAGKKFEITLNGESLAHGSGSTIEGEKTYVQYMTPYTAKLTKKEHYIYDLKVTVNGETVAHDYNSETGIITIAGNLITGPVVIESGEKESDKHDVEFEGAYASHAKYEGESAVYDGESFSFTIETPEGLVIESYQVSYKLGDATEYTALEAVEGTYTIANVTAALTIKIEGTSDLKVEVNEYVKLNGKVVFLVTATQTLPAGKNLAYNSNVMYLKNFQVEGSDTMEQMYSYLVVVNSGETLSVEDAAAMITIVEAQATTLSDTFNVNESTALDINDAQLVYDLYNNVYQDIDIVGMQKFLRADVNGSRNINVSDAAAVVNAILAENQ